MTERTRTKPHNLGQYADCWPVLDAAIKHSGIRVQMACAAEAVKYRHRCYRARKLLADKAAETTKPGQHIITPYDSIKIRLDPHEAKGEEPAALIFEIIEAPSEVLAQITALDGSPIAVGVEENELELEAARLRRDLGLE